MTPSGLYSGAADRVQIRSSRAIVYTSALLAVVIGIVHAAIAPVIVVAGVKPNLILVAVVLVAATLGFSHGILWAFIGGTVAYLALGGHPLWLIPLLLAPDLSMIGYAGGPRLGDVDATVVPLADWAAEEGIADAELHERLIKAADERTAKKAVDIGPQIMRQIERAILLQTLDNLWREHLVMIEHLRQVVGLRGYGQRDPLNEYKSESFTLFEHLLERLRENVTGQLAHVELAHRDEVPPLEVAELPPMEVHHANPVTGEDEFALETANAGPTGNGRGGARPARARKTAAAAVAVNPADPSTWGKVQRNALCPCGSGKKYKHCHGTFS